MREGEKVTVLTSVAEETTPLAFAMLVGHGGEVCKKSLASNVMWSIAPESSIQVRQPLDEN